MSVQIVVPLETPPGIILLVYKLAHLHVEPFRRTPSFLKRFSEVEPTEQYRRLSQHVKPCAWDTAS
jgi:hypothetical protein